MNLQLQTEQRGRRGADLERDNGKIVAIGRIDESVVKDAYRRWAAASRDVLHPVQRIPAAIQEHRYAGPNGSFAGCDDINLSVVINIADSNCPRLGIDDKSPRPL